MANIIRNDTRPLWRPHLYRIFSWLAVTHNPVIIRTRIRLANQLPANVVLHCIITELNGLDGLLEVKSHEFSPGTPFASAPACEYSALVTGLHPDKPGQIEYLGKAVIQERHDTLKGLPTRLSVHFSLPAHVRQRRRHMRQSCASWHDVIPGLALLDSELDSRRQLLSLMRHYYHKKDNPRPMLVNISAGGVCLRTRDVIAQRLMHANDRYLFFFFLKSPLEEKIPWVFLGRKAGSYPILNSPDNGLRIHFLRELHWTEGGADLCWNDITHGGSENLQRMLEDIPEDEPPAGDAAKLAPPQPPLELPVSFY